MINQKPKQLSLYSILYNKIPKNHILKLINSVVNFSFINKLLEGSYCKYYGRPAKEPEMMAKLCILQYLYNLSDVRIIEEVAINLAFMWFLGINPDDELPDASLLAKFRKHRIKGTELDDIITEVVRQCIQKGIIKGTEINIDATHTHANTLKKSSTKILKQISKKIFIELEKEVGKVPDEVNQDIPKYDESIEKDQARGDMVKYFIEVVKTVEKNVTETSAPQTTKLINEIKELLSDPKFVVQKGIRSLVDKEARVGYKTATDSFFGYKTEFTMIADERIITAVEVNDGAHCDGKNFDNLLKQTQKSGLKINALYGDKAYFRKAILDTLKTENIEAMIPVSEMVYKLDESKYSYNKDSDQWFCELGNHTVSSKAKYRKNGKVIAYKFNVDQCSKCQKRNECYKGRDKSRILEVGVNTMDYYELSQIAKTDEFKTRYRKRSSIEWKNGEMKRFHGLYRARGYGLRSMSLQAKLTAIAVNLKRIAAMVFSHLYEFCLFAVKFEKQSNFIPIVCHF